jgi:glyoxylate utilization-related uncharacterized protein
VGVSQQVWVVEGRVELSVAGATHALDAGDCLAMGLEGPIAFHNPAAHDARYVVALAADAAPRGLHRGSAP